MASFGHVAVGLLAGRLHGGRGARASELRCSWWTLAVFAGMAVLPDVDVLIVACGACDDGLIGHRGASHSLVMALGIGLTLALLMRRLGWPVLRTAIAASFAVGSHGVLDALAQGGRGLPLLWPLTEARFHAPWRIIPDAPRGLGLMSHSGLTEVAFEFLIFLPITCVAIWPQIVARWAARKPPALTVITGGAAVSHTTAPMAEPARASDGDPSVRSTG